ncbi:unnamed protein product [Candida verbasci]|uniref:ATPase synthesis protein 25 n=1 Tax=Candida verbasci TaxID=1227364 RepID=A0A9W4XBF2_9ASCO|nr:unnamed protein product [Candida verbasci]
MIRQTRLLKNVNIRSLNLVLYNGFHSAKHCYQEINIPWYLREENQPKIESINSIELPTIPPNSPNSMKDIINLIVKDYGLTDLLIIDLSTLPFSHPKHPNNQNNENWVIISTGKSERHIYKTAYELKHYMKSNHRIKTKIEGMVSNSMSPVLRRRLAKRAKKGMPSTYSDYGILANTWVRCDLNDVVLHILSPERRLELKLEEIYGEESQDVPINQVHTSIDSDNIFHGIRQFHTTTKRSLNMIYDKFLNSSQENIEAYKIEFDSKFTGNSIEEHDLKFQIYKIINLLNEHLVGDHELESVIFNKYESLNLILNEDINWNNQIISDTIKYMELLIDLYLTPKENMSKLSLFLSKILKFRSDEINLYSIDKFQSLLWALSITNHGLTSSDVENLIQNHKPDFTPIKLTSTEQDIQVIQNTRKLIKDYNLANNGVFPIWLRELIMLSYGNLKINYYGKSNWDLFWKEWNGIIENINGSNIAMIYWMRLIVYLTKLNNVDAVRYLAEKHWDDLGVGHSFTNDYKKGKLKDNEEMVLKKALNVLNEQHGQKSWFRNIKQFVDSK